MSKRKGWIKPYLVGIALKIFTLIRRVILLCPLLSLSVRANDSAVILMYHHVSDTTPLSTSISVDDFRKHMAYIKAHHQVLPLPQVVTALQQKQKLPDKTLVITFDDGYRNIFENASPILEEFGFPYTIFINPDRISNSAKQLSWQQVAEMQKRGATFANHTLQHIHMLQKLIGESQQDWLARLASNLNNSEQQLKEKLGYSLKYLAYPYGEYNAQVQQLLHKMGFIGFGQHSGAIHSGSDFTALPRFPAAGRFANLGSLKTKMATLGMPVVASTIKDTVFPEGQLPKSMTLTLDNEKMTTNQFACYFQGDALVLETTADSAEIELPRVLPLGRSRINCTAPSKHKPGRFHWYSQPFIVPTKAGKYLD